MQTGEAKMGDWLSQGDDRWQAGYDRGNAIGWLIIPSLALVTTIVASGLS
jgi:hypothetical protein